jgi:hypothetical protein
MNRIFLALGTAILVWIFAMVGIQMMFSKLNIYDENKNEDEVTTGAVNASAAGAFLIAIAYFLIVIGI